MLLHVPSGGEPTLVSLPRDSYVEIRDNGWNKLNAAHSIGGAELLVDTVEQNTDLRIDGYLEIGFNGFASVVDSLGGVEVCVPFDMDDPDAQINLKKGCQTLDGANALGYVRARHSDPRGDLVETSRAHGGTSQGFVSTTRPGMTRGDHYHLHKIERFFVVRGTADISLRRLLDDEVVTFRLDGSHPGFVDMPTLWVHNITNVGDDDLITVFWADQLLDPVSPDQYPERVHLEVS